MNQLDLTPYRINYISQFGEDGVVDKLFEIANITTGYLVGFGEWNGVHFSNTRYHYRKNPNFKTVLIEPDKERFNELTQNISWTENNILLNLMVEKKGENSLNNIFKKYNVNDIALLSIDVDGEDLNLWNSLDKTIYRPKIVIIENGTWSKKGSLEKLHKSFVESDYSLVCVTGNFIFVDNALGIRSSSTILELMKSSGLPEYDYYYGKITKEEQLEREQRQYDELDLYSKLAEPQYIMYETKF